jgi:hypothetical protein
MKYFGQITKTAAGGPALINPKSGTPSGKSSTSPVAKPSGKTVSNKPGSKEIGGDLPEDQKGIVMTMQQLLNDLTSKITINAKRIAIKLQVPENEIRNLAPKFSNTSGGPQKEREDGIWGKNTKASLVNLKSFTEKFKIPSIIKEGEGESPYKEMKDPDIITIANENIDNIVKIFNVLGLETNVKNIKRTNSGTIYDHVGPELTYDQLENPMTKPGKIAVTGGHLKDLVNFFRLINPMTLEGSVCEPLPSLTTAELNSDILQKLADIILSESIFKLAQQPTITKRPKGHCINEIDDIIQWFAERANALHAQLEENKNPDQDIKNAEEYMAGVRNISDLWNNIRDKVEQILRNAGQEKTPVVTSHVLYKAMNDAASGPGAARRRSGPVDTSSNAETISSNKDYSNILNGPLKPFMRLESDIVKFPIDESGDDSLNQLRSMSQNGTLPNIDMEDFQNGKWISIALNNISGDKSTALKSFRAYASLIGDVLSSMYRNWAYQYRTKTSADVVRQQQRMSVEWQDNIRSIISRSGASLGRALDKLQGT